MSPVGTAEKRAGEALQSSLRDLGYRTAIVTVLETLPPMLNVTGTASPGTTVSGTWALTW